MRIILLLREIEHAPAQSATLWCDNISTIYLTFNLVLHAQIKYIEINYHFIWNQIKLGIILIRFIKNTDQIADILTKLLNQDLFYSFIQALTSVTCHSASLKEAVNDNMWSRVSNFLSLILLLTSIIFVFYVYPL